MANTIQELAQDYADRFEKRTREDKSEFWCVKDDQKTEELTALIHAAHGDMLPDDWRYSFIVEALDAIAETPAEDEEAEDVTLEVDIYTHELTSWLNSRADRFGYCDEALEDWGQTTFDAASKSNGGPTITLLQWGQLREKEEVLSSVRQSLLDILQNEEE